MNKKEQKILTKILMINSLWIKLNKTQPAHQKIKPSSFEKFLKPPLRQPTDVKIVGYDPEEKGFLVKISRKKNEDEAEWLAWSEYLVFPDEWLKISDRDLAKIFRQEFMESLDSWRKFEVRDHEQMLSTVKSKLWAIETQTVPLYRKQIGIVEDFIKFRDRSAKQIFKLEK